MSLLFHSCVPCTWWNLNHVRVNPLSSGSRGRRIGGMSRSRSRSRSTYYPNPMGFNANNNNNNNNNNTACFFNPAQDPIIQEALKEPVAFLGGVFAGILRLDLNEEPLKEWVTRTVEAAGISEEEIGAEGSKTEASPQEIEIE